MVSNEPIDIYSGSLILLLQLQIVFEKIKEAKTSKLKVFVLRVTNR